MKALLSLVLGGLCSTCLLAQTTNTNCTTIGAQTNCSSSTQPDNSESQREAYQTGQALGAGLGAIIARHNQIKNYCKFHPGESWHTEDYSRSGTCRVAKPPKDSKSVTAGAYFTPRSPEAQEWCAHQPAGMSYMASDHNEYDCPTKDESWKYLPYQPPSTLQPTQQTAFTRWIFDGYTQKVQDGISCQYLSSKANDGRSYTKTFPGPTCPTEIPME